jgi:hypothetical protein
MKIHLGPYRKNRKVHIQIDDYDVWNMDHTLSTIIAEMLIKMKQHCHGYPMEFSDGDIREDGINYGGNGGGIKAWYKVIDQMIEGFSFMAGDDWPSVDRKEITKAQHALNLFSHYYMNLWD